ncbi:hypothetical protein [Comamonas sp. SY3]|uniref:hypothetical protein n=1 Tax=Comamonas sp. SY3 TaxID=3243601 RepID=UPI003593563C
MITSRYWRWHIRDDKGEWCQTQEHERADAIKPEWPEAMPVLGSMVLHFVAVPSEKHLYDSLAPDIPF